MRHNTGKKYSWEIFSRGTHKLNDQLLTLDYTSLNLMTAHNWLRELKLFPAGATFSFFCLYLYLMQMKVLDFQPSRRRRHNHTVDRCMLPIQPSPIKLPSLSAAGTFRARTREREREICVWAGALENTANWLFTYYSLQITFVAFLNVSQHNSK